MTLDLMHTGGVDRHVRAASDGRVEIASADQHASIAAVGGALRYYSSGGRQLIDGGPAEERCRSTGGRCLVHGRDHIRGGYEFAGGRRTLHGLLHWARWTVATQAADRVVMEYVLQPRSGYPHALRLAVGYSLEGGGLTVRTAAMNIGRSECPYGTGAHPYLTVGTPTVDSVILQAPGSNRLTGDGTGTPTGALAVTGTAYDFRRPRPIGEARLDTVFTGLDRDGDGRARVHLASPDGATASLWLDEGYRFLRLFTGDRLPAVNRRSLGIGPTTCAPNSFATGAGLITLEPGESFTVGWGIEPS